MGEEDLICININLLAHICLDSELKGRFGLQGNTFKNTVGYLSQYVQGLSSVDPALNQLIASIQSLVQNEALIRDLDSSLKTAIDTRMLTQKMVNKIEQLTENEPFFMPGGWASRDGGHATVYHFQKTSSGLRFSIYNAGGGSELNESWSTPEGEPFYPVSIYEIPGTVFADKLENFIKQLIEPQFERHLDRDIAGYDAQKLDRKISKGLARLDAKLLSAADEINADRATVGQLSGTCSQRSIHQMLKLNFQTLAAYTRFIVQFKMHALRDFIHTHPSPRSPAIADLLQLAIENNLKIVKKEAVFSEAEQREFMDELIQLKERVSASDAIKKPSPDAPLISQPLTSHVTVINNPSLTLANPSNVLPVEIQPIPDPVVIQPNKPILEQLITIISQCRAIEKQNPLWVLEQIDSILLQIPLPQDNPDFYQTIASLDELASMIDQLHQIQQIYIKACKERSLTKKNVNCCVSHWSLLALGDYFELKQASLTNRPSFHSFVDDQFRIIWSELRDCPKLASYHPAMDERIKRLLSHSQTTMKINRAPDYFIKKHYQAIIDRFPVLKAALEREYAKLEWAPEAAYRKFAEEGFSAMIFLSKVLETPDSNFDYQRFAPLIDALQQQMDYEKYIAGSLNAVTNDQYHLNKTRFQCTCLEEKDHMRSSDFILMVESPLNITFVRDKNHIPASVNALMLKNPTI